MRLMEKINGFPRFLPEKSLWLLFTLLLCSAFVNGCSLKHAGPELVQGGVRFSLIARDAKKVVIAGSFNQWDTEKNVLSGPDSKGAWEITLPLLDGRYEYLFLIDGEKWATDPDVPFVDDGMGGRNSVISVKR